MGRRSGFQKTQNRVVILAIFSACCFALYCLICKISRLIELSELDRTANSEAVILTSTYLNASLSGESLASVNFLIHSQEDPPLDFYCVSRSQMGHLSSPVITQTMGPSRLFLGTCDVLEPGFSIELKNLEFSVMLDPNLFPRRRKSVVCLSLAFLYEDLASLKSLIQHYYEKYDDIELYVTSFHESVLREVEKHPKVSIIWWPMLQSFRKKSQDDILFDKDSFQQTVEASFSDCWLRNAPHVEEVSFIEIAGFNLSARGRLKIDEKRFFRKEWRMKTLMRGIVENEVSSLTVSSTCSGWCNKRSSLTKVDKDETTNFALKRSAVERKINNSYEDELKNCVVSKLHSNEVKKTKRNQKTDNPCFIPADRKDYHCRVGSHITKRMFSNKIKISLVQKRTMLRFYDGCR